METGAGVSSGMRGTAKRGVGHKSQALKQWPISIGHWMELINTLMSRPDLHLEREFTGNWARSASELLLYAESSHISSAHTSTRCLPSEDNMRQGQNKGQACPDPIFYLVGIFWLMLGSAAPLPKAGGTNDPWAVYCSCLSPAPSGKPALYKHPGQTQGCF